MKKNLYSALLALVVLVLIMGILTQVTQGKVSGIKDSPFIEVKTTNDEYSKLNTGPIEVTFNGVMKSPFMEIQVYNQQKVAQDTDKILLNEGRFLIDISTDGKERQFPHMFKFGNNIFVSYNEHKDTVMVSPEDGMMISRDNGLTWTKKVRNKDFYFTSMFEKNGVLYGISFYTYWTSPLTEKMVYWTSADYGETWFRHEGKVFSSDGRNFVQNRVWGNLLFYRDMLVMSDGSIQGVMYGRYGTEERGVWWVKSNDNCATWNVVSQIAPPGMPDGRFTYKDGYCEPTVSRVKDGSLLCVMRIGSYAPLYASRSYDFGLTWTKPASLNGLSKEQSSGVDPCLRLMENGVLALSYGRPGAAIAFSSDGCGYNWDHYQMIYAGWQKNSVEGYTAIVETEPGKLLYVADQGRTGATQMAIWGTFLNVNISPQDYVDVAVNIKAKKLRNVIAIGSNGISSTTGSSALVDGNNATVYIPNIAEGTDRNSSVPEHSVVLDMGKVKNLHSIIVRHQFASIWKYKIEVSLTNTEWTTFSDKTNNTSALQISRDDSNINARYVKYTIIGNLLIDCFNSYHKELNYPIHNYISIQEIEIYTLDAM